MTSRAPVMVDDLHDERHFRDVFNGNIKYDGFVVDRCERRVTYWRLLLFNTTSMTHQRRLHVRICPKILHTTDSIGYVNTQPLLLLFFYRKIRWRPLLWGCALWWRWRWDDRLLVSNTTTTTTPQVRQTPTKTWILGNFKFILWNFCMQWRHKK